MTQDYQKPSPAKRASTSDLIDQVIDLTRAGKFTGHLAAWALLTYYCHRTAVTDNTDALRGEVMGGCIPNAPVTASIPITRKARWEADQWLQDNQLIKISYSAGSRPRPVNIKLTLPELNIDTLSPEVTSLAPEVTNEAGIVTSGNAVPGSSPGVHHHAGDDEAAPLGAPPYSNNQLGSPGWIKEVAELFTDELQEVLGWSTNINLHPVEKMVRAWIERFGVSAVYDLDPAQGGLRIDEADLAAAAKKSEGKLSRVGYLLTLLDQRMQEVAGAWNLAEEMRPRRISRRAECRALARKNDTPEIPEVDETALPVSLDEENRKEVAA